MNSQIRKRSHMIRISREMAWVSPEEETNDERQLCSTPDSSSLQNLNNWETGILDESNSPLFLLSLLTPAIAPLQPPSRFISVDNALVGVTACISKAIVGVYVSAYASGESEKSKKV